VLFATRVFERSWDEIRIRARQLSTGRLSVRLARHSPVRCDGQFGEPRQNGLGDTAAEKTNGLGPNYHNTDTPLRRRFRVSPVGIWRRDRYRRCSADRAYRLFVVRTRRIVIFRNCVADILTDTRFVWLFMSSPPDYRPGVSLDTTPASPCEDAAFASGSDALSISAAT
jgi:hypothetical protein